MAHLNLLENQADQARVSDSMFHEAESPSVVETPRSFGSHRAFAAIRSSLVAMTGCSSLCIEDHCLPLGGAHVAQERFTLRWPLPPVVGSPDRRVLSVSL